jgi:deoxyribodipyrimidine photolyase
MTREQLRTIFEGLDNVTDAMLNSVMALHGQSIKAVRDELAAEKTQLATVSAELEKLKATPDKSAELQTKLDELQKKYDADTAELQSKIDGRTYDDAIAEAITKAGVEFTSGSAKKNFVSELKAAKLELKDGAITGFDEFLTKQKEADKDAFKVTDPEPKPKFLGDPGSKSGAEDLSFAARAAKRFNDRFAPSASNPTT